MARYRYRRMRYGKKKLPKIFFILAIWMLPANTTIYGNWPAGGEIDIVEIRANKNYTDGNNISQGVDRFGSTMHFGPRWPHNRWDLAHWEM